MMKQPIFTFFTCLLAFLGVQAQTPQADYFKRVVVRNIGPGAMSGRITAITCDPIQPSIIYAGAASGGVWRSKSGGTNWEPIFDKANTQSVGAIAIHPHNPDEIWVGTGEGNPRNSQNFGIGMYKSIDAGKTWTHTGLTETHAIHRIIIHRDQPNVVFAGVIGSAYGPSAERGVFKTSDGGKTWRKVLYVNDLTGCADLVTDPQNPNKLYAAMWEYKRQPWFFNSGGKGSGLYVSMDGGETWEKRTSKDGLPEGDLGRIGLAVAKNKPEIVYALVEAKENALYKSVDGGKNWKQMASKGQGDRPFYYSELYVDPNDYNTLYSVHSRISRSIDGGKSFENWVGYWDIHPDHHAFWIDPNNSDHIMEGNDGGLNITYDGGKTWRYAENIPVGQFYHLNVDNDIPYNVYGGLQDNGSWVGPSAVWKQGGIRNSDWQEVYFGDGFDVAPRPDDNRYVYAMSQGGELGYVDRKTGLTQYIKPNHPTDKNPRFNWNAAFAQDPFRPCGIYFGSQYLHYSADCGQNWQVLSPDLSTNDTSKMHQNTSGGLTIDATNAENHCTILAIAPSPIKEGLIWVGTDDGNVQITQNGGQAWENVSNRMPDYPKAPWVPQIEVSSKNPGEAFVVVNNYRQNDWQPYLYHTTDFGKKWKRLADAKKVQGFCLSIVQDIEQPNLLFLGTDQGLNVSFDYGENWLHWPNESFPSVPVNDMRIQAREGDLAIATFGRGIWIMDDIRPLRAIAKEGAAVFQQNLKVFAAGPAVMAEVRSYDGPRFSADATYAGHNELPRLHVALWVKPKAPSTDTAEKSKKDKEKAEDGKKEGKKDAKKDKQDKATVWIKSLGGDTLRTFKVNIDSCFNYIHWGFDTKGIRFPSNDEPDPEQGEPGGGPSVLPGDYKVLVAYDQWKDSTIVRVEADPRLRISLADMQAKNQAITQFYKMVTRSTKGYDRLKEAEKTIKLVESQFVNVPDSLKKTVLAEGKALQDSIQKIKEHFFPQKEAKGIQRNPDNLMAYMWDAIGYLNAGTGAPTANAQICIRRAENEIEKTIQQINTMLDQPWKSYKTKAEAMRYSLFKDFDKL
ncbi:MAG: hypothetical protein NW218_15835 [Saprospiraceae bacterium]|nr:hypothetical protein [Saprospiraceae bacterium]